MGPTARHAARPSVRKDRGPFSFRTRSRASIDALGKASSLNAAQRHQLAGHELEAASARASLWSVLRQAILAEVASNRWSGLGGHRNTAQVLRVEGIARRRGPILKFT